ncbi:uncharacterized protein LOC124128026 isoform X1 [Haliotis rufescens]|uniref:uncharacterized protein LOC124128026 isoform X1 n=1 Tax=Haliotis rufescens TaxID=6454 RepID=UPI00201EAC74|nr:uncharacterized protein LOC124128026 isoform X1 [Haliotis rufescens]
MSRKSLFQGAQETESPSNQDRQQLVTSHTTGDTKVPVENEKVTHSGTPAIQETESPSNQDRQQLVTSHTTGDTKVPVENEKVTHSGTPAIQESDNPSKQPGHELVTNHTTGDKKEPSENEISLQSKNQATQGLSHSVRRVRLPPTMQRKWLQHLLQKLKHNCRHPCHGSIEEEHGKLFIDISYIEKDEANVRSFCKEFNALCSTYDGNAETNIRNCFGHVVTAVATDSCKKRRHYGPNGEILRHPGLGGLLYDGSTLHIFSYLFKMGLCFHINVLEMLAIYVAVKLLGPLWYGKMVLAYCDNMCTVNIINEKEGQKINIAEKMILELIKKEEKLHHFTLACKHIKGTDNYKADKLSRYPSDRFIRKYGGSDSCVEYDAGPVLDKFVEICKQFCKILIDLQILFSQNCEIKPISSPSTLFNFSIDILATKLSTALMLPQLKDNFAKLFESVAKELVEGRARDIVQEITHLRHELEINYDNEQYSRRYSLRIRGLPESKDENTEALVMEVLRDLHLDLTASDIDRCYRVGKINMDRNRQVIVKFVNFLTRNKVISNRRMLRQNRSSVYINEDLTKYQSKLFKLTRDLKAKHLISSTWTYDGRVYVEEQPGGVMRVIQCECDLDSYR